MRAEERILLNEIKNRNRKVFEALYTEYYRALLRYAEGMVFDRQVCEDIVQNLFIHLWEDAGKMEIHDSLKGYFFRSVKNRCINHLRDLQIRDRHKLLYLEALLNQETMISPEPEVSAEIEQAIRKMPAQMQAVFRLKYYEGKKMKEIADEQSISENTVKTQLTRAKDKLRDWFLENKEKNLLLFLFFK